MQSEKLPSKFHDDFSKHGGILTKEICDLTYDDESIASKSLTLRKKGGCKNLRSISSDLVA